MKKYAVVTLFPEVLSALQSGITGRALDNKLISLDCFNPRDYTQDTHRTVDDRPYGGGPGMVMKVKPLRDAIQAAKQQLGPASKVIYVSPQGRRLDQKGVEQLAQQEHMVIVAGRYEGIDERVIDTEVDEQWSIGDYVLSGGELPAMVLIDAMTRTLPGALGHEDSAAQDSFATGLLDHPHYTRPEDIDGLKIPEVLASGDHQAITRWRMKQALGRTWLERPDLLENYRLNAEESELLEQFIEECRSQT